MKRSYPVGAFGGSMVAATIRQLTKQSVMGQFHWLALAVAIALLASGTALWSMAHRPSPVTTPATTARHELAAEQILTLPPRIQAQVRGTSRAPGTSSRPAPAQALRPEAIVTLPPRIHADVSGTNRASTNAPRSVTLRAEVIATFPAQVQEQIRQGAETARPTDGQKSLRPEVIMTLPPRIQTQVR